MKWIQNSLDDDGYDEPYIVITCKSITEKINLETKIKNYEERFEKIIHNSENIIFSIDAHGKIIYANKKFMQLFEISEEDIFSVSIASLIEEEFFANNSVEKLSSESVFSLNTLTPLSASNGTKCFFR